MSARRVLGGAALAVSITAGLSVVGSGSAEAAVLPPASIRAAHLSPDTPGVDIYLSTASGTTKLWMSDEKYGQVSPYVAVAPGVYTVSMRLHGAAASKPALMTWKLAAATGDAYTAAAVGTGAKRKGTVLFDDLSLPKAGTGRVRVIQAASVAARANVIAVNGPVVASDTAFASSTGYASVPAGTWPLRATVVGDPALQTSGTVSVPSASVTSILLLDAPAGGLILKTVVDAAGARTAPKGPVPAGGGSTATTFINQPNRQLPADIALAALTLTLIILLGVGGTVGTRRLAVRRSS